MPPDPCTRTVLIGSHVLKRIGFAASKVRDPDENIEEERWHLTGPFDRTAAIVIFKAEADEPPIPNVPVELKELQVQLAERSATRAVLSSSVTISSREQNREVLVEEVSLPSRGRVNLVCSSELFLKVRVMSSNRGGGVLA